MVEINRSGEQERQEVVEDFDLVHLGEIENMSAQHFRFKPGSVVPEHSHDQEQIGFVYQGELTLTVDGEEHLVGAGDAYLLESNEPHSGENRGDEDVIGIDVFAPPREAPNWIED
jgi:quercetin dioxygenase-like cupin family protein